MNVTNPIGTKGFAFLEFVSNDDPVLENQLSQLGFVKTAVNKARDLQLFEQGEIYFLVNSILGSHAKQFAKSHGASVSAMGFLVEDSKSAFDEAVKRGAKPAVDKKLLPFPAIQGVGGSIIYFVEDKCEIINGLNLKEDGLRRVNPSATLINIDHLTHNVRRGEMKRWAEFYRNIFNFKEIRFFDIEGKLTGLFSKAMASPCGNIKIPINESTDDKSQIEEFIDEFNGEGIQHVALTTNDIYASVDELKKSGIKFLTTPDTYYDQIDRRIPWHNEDIVALKNKQILIDGEKTPKHGLLLQIFTENMLGPVFFELIQRKGNDGFGEGNFQALFESIELDQMKRGVLQDK